ncbi:MAG TPA: serine hydrolase [Fimbriiglobus sp.]|nr:serine hydrolase [Fimbriiglobus sp.]
MTKWCLSVISALVICSLAPAADPASLEERIAPLAKEHKGKIAVAVKNLHNGEEYYLDADEPMPTASLIKLPVMVETYWQAKEGKVKLDTMLTLKKDPQVKGSGVLVYHFSDGASFPLRDAVRLMIVYSDNMATNMVLDQIGVAATGERMGKLGLNETRINAKVFRADTRIDQERGKKYGLGSTTAGEMVRLLEMIHAGKVVTPDACKEMLGHLKACDDKEKMTRFLPPGTVVAHKTGSVNASKTDAGIIYVPDPVDKKKTRPLALCVLTDGNEDQRWAADNAAQVTIGKISKAVFDHFAEKK